MQNQPAPKPARRAKGFGSRAEGLLALHQLVLSIQSNPADLHGMLQKTVDCLTSEFGYRAAGALMRDRENNVLHNFVYSVPDPAMTEQAHSLPRMQAPQIALPLDPHACQAMHALMRQQRLVGTSVEEMFSPALSPEVCRQVQQLGQTRTFVMEPLVAKEQLLGAVVIASETVRIPPSQLEMLEILSLQVAFGIQNALTLREKEARLHEGAALYRMARVTVSDLTPSEMMRQLTREIVLMAAADTGWTFLVDRTGQFLEAVAGYHVPAGVVEECSHRVKLVPGSALQQSLQNGQVRKLESAEVAVLAPAGALESCAPSGALFVPLRTRGPAMGGVFFVWWDAAPKLTERELSHIEGMAIQIALAIQASMQPQAAREAVKKTKVKDTRDSAQR
ncbi:MAG: GAF domain-containing protein [Acidobacteriota bacterium]